MSPKAKRIARRLLRQNRGTRSHAAMAWRRIAQDVYENKIPAGTLCRFAKSDGEWLPKIEYQYVLGLKHKRKAKPQDPPESLSTPRIVHTLNKLGYLDQARIAS